MFARRVLGVAAGAVLFLVLVSGCEALGLAPPTPTNGGPSAPAPSPSVPSSSGTPSTPPRSPIPITIDLPPEGETVTVPFTASGTANTFEAALTVDVVDEAGDRVCVRHIMATSGTGTPGTWQTTLAFAPTSPHARQPLMLRAYELSAKDGSIVNLVERTLTLATRHPAIMLTSPLCGDTFAPGGPMVVAGLATVFEAALTVEVRNSAGTVVLSQDLLAAVGGEESPFSATLMLPADLPGGFYDVVAFNYSAKDGSIENEFAVQILVQP